MAAAMAPEPPAPEPEPFYIPEDVPKTVIMPPSSPKLSAAGAEPVPASEDTSPLVSVTPATIMMPPTAPSFGFENDIAEAPIPAPHGAAARPSKDDQAALDALLNAAPIAPVGGATERRPSRSEVRPPQPSPRPPVRRSARGPSSIVLGGVTLLLIAAAVGAAWYVWGPTPRKAAPKQAAGTATAATPMPAVAATPPPTLPAATTHSVPAPVTLSSRTTTAPAPAPPRPARAAPANLAEARTLLKSGDLDAAAQGFAATVKAAPAHSASVQILVACSPETVQKAVQNAGSPELFIVPVNYKGRDCYRLCWGLYESSSRAASAVASLPEYFRKGATPRVIGASEIVR
jgi:septal ring-binding cell division protein DamX